MYRRILVPVDLSDRNTAAVETALELANRSDGTIALLHVIETIDDVPFEEIKDFYSGLEERALESMKGLVSAAGGEEEKVERRIVYGRRLREILIAAGEMEADLIVLHSHRVEPGDRATGIGTLSHEVAVMAEVSVMLVK